MNSIDIISKIKNDLINKDINAIQKYKLQLIKDCNIRDTQDKELIKCYNYHVKLMRKIKKYLKESTGYDIIINAKEHQESDLITLISKINPNEINIGISVDIRLLTGSSNESYMDCTYYSNQSTIYINDFRSSMSNRGYGKIILDNLDEILEDLNKTLEKYDLNKIMIIKGKMIANKHIISEENLKKMYIKYGFEVDNSNNILKVLNEIM
ncbi:hypothetical protein [Romboutsia lituseburensis]|uniref:hypothetical protein n=1 Tax=Romboutsia lituseburensis TaxID=1537 RepID=UPI00215AB4A6|nr:hypothetical protein [Romboutsia lituseburensis]MCR8743773.1 hypothetical protein [Romboutsia lituseburensis]